MTLLIVSDPTRDVHLPPVVSEMQRRGHEIFIFDPGGLPGGAKVNVESANGHLRRELGVGEASLDLDSVSCAWFRKPSRYSIPDSLDKDEQDWLRTECRYLVRSLWEITDAFWVSDPHLIQRAGHKLYQLQIAAQLGLDIPDYIITNRAADARGFVESHPEGVIVKAIGRPTLESMEQPGMIYTHCLTDDDVAQIESVEYGPTFLQEFVRKKYDIRVTVFGERLFAVAIDATKAEGGSIDFRRADTFKVPHYPVELPAALEQKCIDLVKRLGLRYGAIDLLQTPDDDYIFLEINPNGQWLWMELLTEVPMTLALCDLLESGVPEERRPAPQPVASGVARATPETEVFQIGDQQFALPSSLRGVNGNGPGSLAGTNVLFEEIKGELSLYVGDIEAASE